MHILYGVYQKSNPLVAEWYSIVKICYVDILTPSPVEGYFSCLQFGAVLNKVVKNILVKLTK